MAGLGWKRVAPQFPYVDGELWDDGVSRTGNNVNFSFNLKLVLPTSQGYWNYAWYVDIECGNVKVQNKKVKNAVNRNIYITGVEYWYSSFNGNFTGQITVDGKASTIPVTVTFHDSAGNWGTPQTWNVPIPTASAMGDIKSSVSVTGPDTATIRGSVDTSGAYSAITKWQLNYGINSYSENEIVNEISSLSSTWNLTSLQPATYYKYKIQVLSNSGYSKTYTGNFRTEDSEIGRLIIDGQPTKILTGWIVQPEGTKRIKEIRKIV